MNVMNTKRLRKLGILRTMILKSILGLKDFLCRKYSNGRGEDNMEGMKHDNGKPRLALTPSKSIKAIGTIMTYGANKYHENSWKGVEVYRYRDALMRHICEYLDDPHGVDEESGYPHIWHVIANAAILCDLEDSKLSHIKPTI